MIAIRIWIALSVLAVASGWILSAVHQLNRAGYAAVLVLAAAAGVYGLKRNKWSLPENPGRTWHKVWRRFRRPAPLLLLVLFVMSLVAGLIYIPSNGDSNAYRTPRVLHWLGNEGWHWIYTFDDRLNVTGCAFEWLTAPLIVFTRTDRWMFLINWISYLLLPGLIFGLLTRLQVRPRVAWWWTWLLSAGWCFALQSSSIRNDHMAAVYGLAAVVLALRARETQSRTDLCLSLCAAALLTGVKATNVPLVLLWCIAALPSWRLLLQRPLVTAAVAGVAVLCSFIPVAIANLQHERTWVGMPKDSTWGVELHSPVWAILGNVFCLSTQNLMPPFFPWANKWNAAMEQFLQTPFGSNFKSFESFGLLSYNMNGVSETNAGIGLGVCFLLAVSLLAVVLCPARARTGGRSNWRSTTWWLRIVPWGLLLLFMAKVGTFENARHLVPYYVFLFPVLLIGSGQSWLVRRRWWQWLGLLVMLATAGMLVVSRSRPLFPAQTILNRLQAAHPESRLISRVGFSFGVRTKVDKCRDHFREFLPSEERVIGFSAALGCVEVGLWLPFGERRVEWILPGEDTQRLRQLGVRYVLVEDSALQASKESIEQLAERYNSDLVEHLSIEIVSGQPPLNFYLVRFRSG